MEKLNIISLLVKEIKEKKELSGISDSIVKEALSAYLEKNRINILNSSKQDKKLITKEVRSQLRLLNGRFQPSIKKRSKIIASKNYEKILETHSSTKERLLFYPKLKELIDSLNVNSIVDLGCGLNPIALSKKDVSYYAYDINESELNIINDYFKQKGITGFAKVYDLRKFNSSDFPKADLCIIFKVLDIIGKNKYEITESILNSNLFSKFLISFSTKKLSGKKMNQPKRLWFESTLSKLNMNFKTIESENEIFYLIER